MLTPLESATWLRYMIPGTYVFRLTVTDNNGATSSDDVIINVTAIATSNPANPTVTQVYAADTITLKLPTNQVYIRPTITMAADRKINEYKWSKISGPSQYFITSTNTAVTTLNYLVTGNYTFRFSITDNLGVVTYDDVIVNVLPATSSAAGRTGDVLTESSLESSKGVTLYPNPADNVIRMKWDADFTGAAIINLVDADGKTIKSLTTKKETRISNLVIDVSTLKQGVYLMEVKASNGKTYTSKFIKR